MGTDPIFSKVNAFRRSRVGKWMARVARIVVAGYPLHVVQRGLNRQPCFYDQSDYEAYLRFLAEFSSQFGCSLHAYCLMTNHVHLLLTPLTTDACASVMKLLGQCHVQRINHRLGRSGTLWEGRYYSSLAKTDNYVLACYRYIEQNPVRAAMVHDPQEYRWSSHRANAGLAAIGMLSHHPSSLALHANDEARTRAYRDLCAEKLPESIAEEIRKATRVGGAVGAQRRKRGRPFKQNK